jgi:hypothetical protein
MSAVMAVLLLQLASVADTGSVTVTEPSPLPPPGDVEFASNWTNGLGRSEEALGDGGIWQNVRDLGGAPTIDIIAQPGAWWPMPTAFRVVHNETAAYAYHDTPVPVPEVGQVLYHRFLFAQQFGPARNVIVNGNHGISSGAGTGATAGCAASGSDIWTLRFGDLGRDGDANRFMFGIGRRDYYDLTMDLDKERAYVIEVALYRSGTSIWQLHPRLLDPLTGIVVAGPSDFVERNNSSVNLGQGINFTLQDPGCLVRTYVGTNGAGGFSGVIVLAGAWAIRRGDGLNQWIGWP